MGYPPGHLGNLDAEQESKLRKMWEAIFKVNKILENITSTSNGSKSNGVFTLTGEELKAEASIANLDTLGLPDELWAQLSSRTPDSIRSGVLYSVKHEHPDTLLLRFLRARKWNVNRALVMMFAAINWRYNDVHLDDDILWNGEEGAVNIAMSGNIEDSPLASTLASDFMKQVRMGKCFIHGTDREGRPICHVRVRLHKASDQSSQSIERYTAYLIETGRLLIHPPVETVCLLFDMTGFGLANMDYTPLKFIIKCFEANYPESLGVILVHNAPWIFNGFWKIIRSWLDPVVASKVHFTHGTADLVPFIDLNDIIKELGGDEDWEYRYDEPELGENDRMKDTETRERLLEERKTLAAQFEGVSQDWVANAAAGKDVASLKAKRDDLATQMGRLYWVLDPYIRARSIYDRQDNIAEFVKAK